jgi:hypothetical protein
MEQTKKVILLLIVTLLFTLSACNQKNENNKKKLDEKVFTQGQTLTQFYYSGIHGKEKKTEKIKSFQQHFQDAYLSDNYDSEDEGVFILTIASMKTKYEAYKNQSKERSNAKKEIESDLQELHKEFGIEYKK